MYKVDLESRVQRLERLMSEKETKNELFGLEKPTRTDEAPFVNKLYKVFPSLKSVLTDTSGDKSNLKSVFHLMFNTNDPKRYHGLGFIISTASSKNKMYVTAFNSYNKQIETLKPVNIDKDLKEIGSFMIKHINKARNESYKNK